MKWAWVPIGITAIAVGLAVWFSVNLTNPDSFICFWTIYKQPDGTYEVWMNGRTRQRKLAGATYEQAKAFQIKECRELREFVSQRPHGERVK